MAEYISGKEIIGFYFKFNAKCHPNARAYFCSPKDLPKRWSSLCPLTTLAALAHAGLLHNNRIFPPSRFSGAKLTQYMHTFSESNPHFSPHSLRIGGQTFYSLQNMHDDFVHFWDVEKFHVSANSITEQTRWTILKDYTNFSNQWIKNLHF